MTSIAEDFKSINAWWQAKYRLYSSYIQEVSTTAVKFETLISLCPIPRLSRLNLLSYPVLTSRLIGTLQYRLCSTMAVAMRAGFAHVIHITRSRRFARCHCFVFSNRFDWITCGCHELKDACNGRLWCRAGFLECFGEIWSTFSASVMIEVSLSTE